MKWYVMCPKNAYAISFETQHNNKQRALKEFRVFMGLVGVHGVEIWRT